MKLILLAMLVGCGGGGTQGGVSADAGPSPRPDAQPDAGALADAGLDAATPPDARPDAVVDASPPDAPVDAAPDAVVDAPPDAVVDAGPPCPAPTTFGVVMPRAPHAVTEAGPPPDLKYSDPLDVAAQPDIFKLVLIEGRGAFTSGYAPQTIQLGGVEAAYATCGACVEIFSNVDANNNFAAFYLATSGTLTITSFSPRLTGTLTNANLVHLDDDDSADADHCTTHIDALSFDVPVE